MADIQVLDKHVAELIAAGEVVERPASVAKELIENAVDAGASCVTVELQNGGVTFLRVTDNGCGIDRDDVPTAFLRHATSKIRGERDLESIGTLGFRGEALASIAAVARVELLTRAGDSLAGTRYGIEGGAETVCEDAGCPKGTTIIVRDLFYNTPARMKFLKKDMVEANAVAAVLDKIALSHPEVSFRFLRDGRETLHTPGSGALLQAVYAVYGKQFTEGLIPVEYEYNHIRLSGFVSRPAAARPNRSMQHFFLNGRYVKSRTVMVALEEAYKGSVMAGKFPACVLHMELAPEAVDVNVHPAKIEVRFLSERPVFDSVYHAVKTALVRGDEAKVLELSTPKAPVREALPAPPQLRLRELPPLKREPSATTPAQGRPLWTEETQRTPWLSDAGKAYYTAEPAPPEKQHETGHVQRGETAPLPVRPGQGEAPPAAAEAVQETGVVQAAAPSGEPEAVRIRGEVFGVYILVEYGRDRLLFIDKHAAHERLLYEKIKGSAGSNAQQLLTPVSVTLGKEEYAAVLSNLDLLRQAGFEAEDFGAGAVLVRSVPLYLEAGGAAGAVMEIAGYLAENRTDLTTERLDWLYHNIACRAAIKAGDESSGEELLALIRELAEHPEIRYCPHGRPICTVMRRRDLDRQFGRV